MGKRKSIILLVTAFAIVSLLYISLGPVILSVKEVLHPDERIVKIILFIRLPRLLTAFVVGWCLSLSGAVLQSLFNNPLAEPYLTGISGVSAIGAVLSFLAGFPISISDFHFLSVILSIGVVYLLLKISTVNGTVDLTRMILAGVMISAFCGSTVVFLLSIFPPPLMKGVFFWIMGNLGGSNFSSLLKMFPFILGASLLILYHYRELNIISLGPEQAMVSGVDVNRLSFILILGTGILVSVSVSLSGMIGFTGLIVPNIVRMMLGPVHPALSIFSGFYGGIFMVLCDLIGRIIVPPREIPVGIITAFAGTPFFLYLLKRR